MTRLAQSLGNVPLVGILYLLVRLGKTPYQEVYSIPTRTYVSGYNPYDSLPRLTHRTLPGINTRTVTRYCQENIHTMCTNLYSGSTLPRAEATLFPLVGDTLSPAYWSRGHPRRLETRRVKWREAPMRRLLIS